MKGNGFHGETAKYDRCDIDPPEKLSLGGELPGTCKAWRALHAGYILTYVK